MKGKKRKNRKAERAENSIEKCGWFFNILKTSWSVQVKVFFENSTLHGVKYIAENGRPFFEKFMWFVCVFVGLITSIIIIFSLWEKFQTNPTITGLNTDFHNWDVPFPAIIICLEKPANETLIDELIEEYSERDESLNRDEFKKFLETLTQLTYENVREIARFSKFNFTFPREKSAKEAIFPLMIQCEEVFEDCNFKSKPYNCCEGFFPVFTESGFCYSFNSRHYERKLPWSDEELPVFEKNFIKETDLKWNLGFTIKQTNNPMPIYILNSDEMAGLDMKPQHVWEFQTKSISFSVKETYTTEDTKQLSIKQRHCIFPDERKQEIDEIYTYTACTRQCRMDNSMKLCNCVPYFYNFGGSTKYVYCNIHDFNCVGSNLDKILNIDKCECQLGCSNTVYEVEKLTFSDDKVETLETEFLSWPMIRYKREVLFGWADLLVSFGGIAGLFLGFSLLSGVEIVYYFTVRAYFMIIKERKTLEKIQFEEKLKPPPNYDLSLMPYFISRPLPGNGCTAARTQE